MDRTRRLVHSEYPNSDGPAAFQQPFRHPALELRKRSAFSFLQMPKKRTERRRHHRSRVLLLLTRLGGKREKTEVVQTRLGNPRNPFPSSPPPPVPNPKVIAKISRAGKLEPGQFNSQISRATPRLQRCRRGDGDDRAYAGNKKRRKRRKKKASVRDTRKLELLESW